MSTKNTNAQVLWNDLKVSFKFAIKNIISFILAMFGVLIVTGLIVALLAAIIVIPLFLSGGLFTFIDLLTMWLNTAQALPGAAAFLVILAMFTPLFAPFMVALGALYGMGREIVESEGTTAEGVFSWYGKKFLPLAGAGIVQFIILVAPLALGILIVGPVNYSLSDVGLAAIGLSSIVIYFAIVSGLLSLVFPAVIDGKSVIESVKISFKLSTKYFDRVFSVWLSYLGILLLTLIPLFGAIMLDPSGPFGPEAFSLISYVSIMMLFDILVLLPALVIGMNRIYMILVSDNMSETTSYDQEPFDEVSFVGGD